MYRIVDLDGFSPILQYGGEVLQDTNQITIGPCLFRFLFFSFFFFFLGGEGLRFRFFLFVLNLYKWYTGWCTVILVFCPTV